MATGSVWSMGPYRATHWLTSRRICCLLLQMYVLRSCSLPPVGSAGSAWKVGTSQGNYGKQLGSPTHHT